MKQLFAFFTVAVLGLAACSDSPQTTTPSASQTTNPTTTTPVAAVSNTADSIAITEALHGFFKWYNSKGQKALSGINLIQKVGKHGALNEAALRGYLGQLTSSGFVSQEFIENQTNLWRACAKNWANEDPAEVVSCLDADQFYCAQDGSPEEFEASPVFSVFKSDRAEATINFKNGSYNGDSRTFSMKKENGKWLLAKTSCDLGVKY